MSKSSPRAVFFDLGGTLFSYRDVPDLSRPIFEEAVRRLRVELEPGEIGPVYARAVGRSHGRFVDRDYYLHRDLFHDSYRELVRDLGVVADDGFFEWLYAAQRRVMVEAVPLRDDCIETLRALRDRGFYLSIVSNIDDDYLEPMVHNFGLAPHLDHWSSSEEARSCKPHPAIFELALEKAGCTAEEVVFVGDSRHHDVRGSRAMGMTSVLIDEGGAAGPLDSGDDAPHHVITSLRELTELLE